VGNIEAIDCICLRVCSRATKNSEQATGNLMGKLRIPGTFISKSSFPSSLELLTLLKKSQKTAFFIQGRWHPTLFLSLSFLPSSSQSEHPPKSQRDQTREKQPIVEQSSLAAKPQSCMGVDGGMWGEDRRLPIRLVSAW